ncbi:LCP family protein [Nonomuraea africana]|uniref:LCP family protein required for cell wall assembly n=1 Tax=Nonomuraea africana TaxID=46171 RepID=A0ABR9KUK8_9ACTN|nr:LCP family protein [Nonomuraea africana]MBE1565718.1 LCP family protein required for cell wall assembly [Nonomuraea africana]
MSNHRSADVQDRLVAPATPGYRSSRRAGASPPPPPPPEEPRGRRSGDGGRRKLSGLAWTSIALTGLMVAGSLTGYTIYRSALAGFGQNDPDTKIRNPRPANITGALNVLIVGSDTRHGEGNARYGQAAARIDSGKRTDTMILMHISPTRDKAQLISFPRDSMVQIPQCEAEKSKTVLPATRDMINSAYNRGGIACTITTIETLTNIRIDHNVEVDFNGFKAIVDELHGIEVCLNSPVDDKKAKLKLPRGRSTLNGEQALGYVRLRAYGNHSDLERIKRQQLFASQVVKKITTGGVLSNPPKLIGLIQAASSSVTMDKKLANDPNKLLEIAQSARSLTASKVQFYTVPVLPDPTDPNRVIWDPVRAPKLFEAIRNDTALPEPTPTAKKFVPKVEQVKVQVINGTTTQGKAGEVAQQLTELGFNVVGTGNALTPEGTSQPKTQLLYGKRDTTGPDYAGVLASKLSGTKRPSTKGKVKVTNPAAFTGSGTTQTVADKGADKTPVIQLLIGDDFTGVRTEIPESIKETGISADTKNICA